MKLQELKKLPKGTSLIYTGFSGEIKVVLLSSVSDKLVTVRHSNKHSAFYANHKSLSLPDKEEAKEMPLQKQPQKVFSVIIELFDNKTLQLLVDNNSGINTYLIDDMVVGMLERILIKCKNNYKNAKFETIEKQ